MLLVILDKEVKVCERDGDWVVYINQLENLFHSGLLLRFSSLYFLSKIFKLFRLHNRL